MKITEDTLREEYENWRKNQFYDIDLEPTERQVTDYWLTKFAQREAEIVKIIEGKIVTEYREGSPASFINVELRDILALITKK